MEMGSAEDDDDDDCDGGEYGDADDEDDSDSDDDDGNGDDCDECDFDDEEFDELYSDIDLSEAFVMYEVDSNNFDFSDESLKTLVEWKDAVLREEKMHKDYNMFTKVDDDKGSKEWNVDEEDDDGVSGPEYSSFACNNCKRGAHNKDKCLAITQQEVQQDPQYKVD